MFLRGTNRRKDGKDHRYFSVVENRRLSSGKTAQRTVLYLGEINDRQAAAWRTTLDVFDEQAQRHRTLSLFPDDREIPRDALDGLQVKLSGLAVRRPRAFGACWPNFRGRPVDFGKITLLLRRKLFVFNTGRPEWTK